MVLPSRDLCVTFGGSLLILAPVWFLGSRTFPLSFRRVQKSKSKKLLSSNYMTLTSHLSIDQMVSPLKTHKALLLFIWVSIICSDQVLAKSRHPISDTEIRERKTQCYADVESGLWGWQCKSSMVAKENCALRCLSPSCYELIYESDPLEEGEKDYVRSQEYKYCMHRLSLGESLDGVKGSFD